MYCTNCGKKLESGEKFCTACGTPVAPDSGSVDSPPAAPSGKKLSTGALVGIIVGAVVLIVVIACAVLFATGVIGGAPAQEEPAQSQNADIVRQDAEERGEDMAAGVDEVEQQLSFTGMTDARASSTLPTGGVNTKDYSAPNVLDGDTDTVWCEGDSGNGSGETITLSSANYQKVSGFRIWSGYHESSHLYDINARPHEIGVTANGEEVLTVDLNDAGLTSQNVEFPEPVITDSLTIEILSVYDGSKYSDCCISEIACY